MAAAMALRERVFEAVANSIWGGTDQMTPELVIEAYRIADAILVAINQTDDGVPAPGPTPQPAVSPVAPSSPMPRAFELIRYHDPSGVSGTGSVAEGVEYSDGSVALRWKGDHPATAVWPSLDDVLAVHGHQGATVVRWLDAGPIDWPTEGGPQ